jgi:hypothetical protein
VRFTDFLKATVMTSAGAATALAAVTVAGASSDGDNTVVFVALGWWAIAGVVGARLGHGHSTTPPIAHLLSEARTETSLPEVSPGRVLLNRLWPLLLSTVAAGGLAVLAPQVPAVAAGFAIIWALAWRRQESAVTAIEERDGVRFYIERTSPVSRIKLVRTPGFKAARPTAERPA